MTALSEAFIEIAAITRKHRDTRVTSSVAEHNAILSQLREMGRIKRDISGGTEIQRSVALVENATIQNYSGWDPLNTGSSESTYPARFPWAQKAIHVSANGKELRMNASKEKMTDLVQMRQEIAEETASNRMSIELYGDATAYESINGLELFLPDDGLGTIGTINATNYVNWRAKTHDLASQTSNTDVEEGLATLYKKCRVGKDRPDLGIASHDLYTLLEKAIMQKTRYHGYMSEKKANFNFEHIIFKNDVPIVYDENANFSSTAERIYLLNTKHMSLQEHPEAQWDFEEARRAVNVDGVVIPAYWMGNLVIEKRRTMGKLHDTT